MPPLVVGFDLDMTLIDGRPGILATIEALNVETGVPVDGELMISRLGPTIEMELANYFPESEIPPVADRYRELYATLGPPGTILLPGAIEAVSAVRDAGGPRSWSRRSTGPTPICASPTSDLQSTTWWVGATAPRRARPSGNTTPRSMWVTRPLTSWARASPARLQSWCRTARATPMSCAPPVPSARHPLRFSHLARDLARPAVSGVQWPGAPGDDAPPVAHRQRVTAPRTRRGRRR